MILINDPIEREIIIHGGLMNQSLLWKISSLAILLMPLSATASDVIKKVATFDSTWDIFWGEFIEPRAWDTSTTRRPDETASLLNLNPSNSTSNPKRYRYATFRKVLNLPENEAPYAIYFPVLRGASVTYHPVRAAGGLHG